jgi:hypothetical protein
MTRVIKNVRRVGRIPSEGGEQTKNSFLYQATAKLQSRDRESSRVDILHIFQLCSTAVNDLRKGYERTGGKGGGGSMRI